MMVDRRRCSEMKVSVKNIEDGGDGGGISHFGCRISEGVCRELEIITEKNEGEIPSA